MNTEELRAAQEARENRQAHGQALALTHLANALVLRAAQTVTKTEVEQAVNAPALLDNIKQRMSLDLANAARWPLADCLSPPQEEDGRLVFRARIAVIPFEELCELLANVWNDGYAAGEAFGQRV